MSERYRETVDPAAPNSAHAMAIRMVGHDRRVLEVGCSVGHVTEHLVANGNRVVGVEIDPAAAEEARRFATAVHVADLDRTTLDELVEGPFDVIVFGDVLEHLRDPSVALDSAVRLLADDGQVVVSIPNVAHADLRLMLLEGRWEYQDNGLLDDTHLRFVTREGLRDLLGRSGLVATEVDRVVIPIFATNLPVTPELHGEALRRFVLADPEALTFQFVVTARRRDAWRGDDVLERPPLRLDRVGVDEARLRQENGELRAMLAEREAHEAALLTELDAWRNSTLARVSRPLRAAWGRIAHRVRR